MEALPFKRNRFQLNKKTKEVIVFIICLACIFLFLSSAYSKLLNHEQFVQGLKAVSFLRPVASELSWLVPVIETSIAALLIMPRTTWYGLIGFAVVMVAFTIYIAGMMIWADKLPCSCNLFIEKLSWSQHLIFNIGFVFLSIIALWLGRISNYKILVK
ncbi:hypothetical protein J7E50_12750 [Pedobacter sp. ISL-68]|uniref:MauE/DoxX family redox-associated membrane protein n=1 Tax=unclassified Pedobacter TaxID=2628915 RepID=UPI001BEC7DB8|nr:MULTISPECIES: MauE/DoxX family redox-associated membrane protein [unclassified Pedobacter]MBT2561706.1 hypothetical protein [Pedobacter sp. ISL-64]MBT2591094.1 hypothetical protein [Pedobacter sp. ISL-68]